MAPRVLFAPIHAAALLEMLPVAAKLQEEGRFEPVFFLFRDIGPEQVERLQGMSIRAIGPLAQRGKPAGGPAPAAPARKADHKGWRQWLKPLSHRLQNSLFPGVLLNLAQMRRVLSRARLTLQQENVAALVTVGDRHVGWETALIKAGLEQGIPTLITPYTLSDPQGAAQYRLRQPDARAYQVHSPLERWLARRRPSWVQAYAGEQLFFMPPAVSLAAGWLQIMPDHPWTLGGGSAACMAVENEQLRRMFLDQGVPAEKMVVTGKPSSDEIFTEVQKAAPEQVRAELGLGANERMLLLSVPHLGEHGLLPWDEHWREMDFLFSALAQVAASQADLRVVLSLHPKSKPEDYQPLAERYGAVLARQRIYQLLPACHLFVSNYSGAVMVAAGLGKPTVVIDFYGLNYTYFDQEPGMVVLRGRDRLVPTLERLCTSPADYQQLAEAQASRASAWMVLDGQCTRRVTGLLEGLVAGSRGKAEI